MLKGRHSLEAVQPGRRQQREGRSPTRLQDRYGGQGLEREWGFATVDTSPPASWA